MYPKLILFNLLFITLYYTINYTEYYEYHKKNILVYHNEYFRNTTLNRLFQ